MDADQPVVIRHVSLPRQVADFIRQAIERGDYEPGAILPPERIMVERFGVSLTVVRQALLMLVAEGLVTKVNGKGTVVRGRTPTTEIITRTAQDPWTQLTLTGAPEPRRATADKHWARTLDVMDGSPLFILDRAATHTATGRRVLTRRILPNRTFEPMDENAYPDPFGPRDQIIQALIKHHGPLAVTERIRPLIPSGDERDALKLAAGDLMLIAVRVTRGKDGLPLMAESERYGEGIELEYQLF